MKKLLYLCAILLFSTGQLLAQKTITGTIIDEKGAPVANVSVIVKGTSTGTITKQDGTYSLNIPSSAKQLEFSSTGFILQTLNIGTGNEYSVTLVSTLKSLDEVVITGYSSIKKSQYAGAATKIGKDKVNFVPNASFDQILQGKVPGLLVTAGSGQPGTAARVQIRGAVSITGGNSPLYVVDGMPIEGGVFQSMNPNDFESVEVLKDAIATAQYGNRGSSGVIVVTTKRGRTNKLSVTYSGQGGFTEAGQQKFDMMNSTQLLQFQEILGQEVGNGLPGWVYSRKNPANASLPAATLSQFDRNLDSLRAISTNWKDVFLERGTFKSHDLNFSGLAGNTRYYLSGGYYDEDGIGLRSDLKRYTARANIESKTDKLTFTFNGSAGYTNRDFIESENGIALANPFAAAYLGLPYQKLYNDNGTVATGPGRVGPNAFDRISTTTSFSDQLKFLGSMNLTYNITKNFYIGGFAGIDYRQTTAERSVFPNTYAANTAGFPVGPASGDTIGKGSYNNGLTNFMQTVVRAIGGYRKVFSEVHDIDIQVVSEYTREKQKNFAYTGYGISTKLLNTPAGITPGTVGNALIPGVGGFKTGRSLYGALALAKYSYKGKYTLNGSYRRDASSQLPLDNRWANFYAAGVSWNITRENFAEKWNNVNELKLRASYGTAANADGFPFGDFGYLATYGNGSYAGNQTIAATNAGNPDLKWERIATLNLGLDFGFLKNRVTGSVDVYDKRGSDQVVTQKLPAESGFLSQDINAAVVSNRGVELALNIEVARTNNLLWSVGGNVSYNKNKVVSLGQVNEFEQGTEIVRVGLPLGSHYIVKWAGVDAATGSPLYYKKDGTITNVYSDDDRVADFGTFNAPWIGGFNTAVNFKGFTLDALFSFQQGFKRFNNQDFFQLNHAFASQGFNVRQEMLTMWQKPGDVTNIQSPLYQRQFVSKDIQDASYLRFRTLTLAYNLQRSLLDKLSIFDNVRLYVQGQNLYTWTNWVGFDPEDNDNIAAYEYPTPRTLTFGINVTFK
ncbi:MAG: SusC/RagA family TonB-linked outer membrane protein [Ferruginibacter sp.]